MNKFLFVNENIDDAITSQFDNAGYFKISNFIQFQNKLNSIDRAEPLRLGFILDCSKKGLDESILDFITELISTFQERTFEYFFAIGIGKYSRFNISALEGILMYYSANISYSGILKSRGFSSISDLINDVDNCKIKLIWKAIGVNFYIPKIVKKIDNWLSKKSI